MHRSTSPPPRAGPKKGTREAISVRIILVTMCGRFQLSLSAENFGKVFPGATWREGHAEDYTARNNVRPANKAPVLMRNCISFSSGDDTTGAKISAEIVMMHVS